MAADIPCGYNETGFHEVRAPDISPEQIQTVTFSALSQYPGAPLAGVPRLSEPGNEVKSNIDLINDAVDPLNTITGVYKKLTHLNLCILLFCRV